MQFSAIIGQDKIKNKLIESVQQKRIGHAQLFLGKNGYGTLALALAYAAYILCENPGDEDACGVCNSCKKVKKLVHPDLHFSFPFVKTPKTTQSKHFFPTWRSALIENPYLSYFDWMEAIQSSNKQGNIPAEECHAIIENLYLRSFEGGYKIQIIWKPEFLDKEGNILLKIIEEPAPNTLILLVAEEQERILGTILSRTQVLNIPPIAEDALSAALIEKDGLSSEKARELAYLSDGDYHLAVEKSKSKGENDFEFFAQWMRLAFKPGGSALWKLTDEFSKMSKEKQKNTLQYSLNLLQISIYAAHLPEKIAQHPQKPFLEKFAQATTSVFLEKGTAKISEGIYLLERNVHPKILFFDLTLQLNHFFKNSKNSARHS